MYWRLRSRISRLKWGDKNTKYFHATAVQRRQGNRILALKIDESNWCREPNALKEHIVDFYQSLYEIVRSRNFGLVIAQCSCIVRGKMNVNLIVTIWMEKVTEAVY